MANEGNHITQSFTPFISHPLHEFHKLKFAQAPTFPQLHCHELILLYSLAWASFIP